MTAETAAEVRPIETVARPANYFESPEWIAERKRQMASPLYARLKAFVASAEALVNEAVELADLLKNVTARKCPFHGRDAAAAIADDLSAGARMIELAFLAMDSEL